MTIQKTKRVRKDFLIAMFKENTGIAMCDSGGENGRAWQRNQGRDFTNEPEYTVTMEEWGKSTDHHRAEVNVRFSLYHNLMATLKEDKLTKTFNRKFRTMKDWDCDAAYGVSEAAGEWLENGGFTFGQSYNSYNDDNNFDGVVQYTMLEGIEPEQGGKYLLLQLHGGADVRGGYTDAKMFVVSEDDDTLFMVEPWATFTIERDEKEYSIDYIPGDGYYFSGDSSAVYEPMIGDEIVD